jgi:hypothetical protein
MDRRSTHARGRARVRHARLRDAHAACAARAAPPAAAAQHLLTLEELGAKHGTHVDAAAPAASRGLTKAQAAERLVTFGPNVLTPPKQTPAIIQFLLKARRGPGRMRVRARARGAADLPRAGARF